MWDADRVKLFDLHVLKTAAPGAAPNIGI